jgi:LuxR family maltose regulon positive regulatory protein
LRVRGQLLEIRTQDLRFSREETTCFLRERMGLQLLEEDIAALQQRTHGWIAGLQLAALTLSKHEDPKTFVKEFTGNHRYLLDYVQQDILSQLPVQLQDFLLQTSIVTKMNAAVCQAVTALPTLRASQGMLEQLERANLFVIPLDSGHQWYRYHDLFREALLAGLRATQPDLVPSLHQRAAAFYKVAGELREAIEHALAAPDYPYAADVMELAAQQFWLGGEARNFLNWVIKLPDAVLSLHARLALNATLHAFNSAHMGTEATHASMIAQVKQIITHLEELSGSQPEQGLEAPEPVLIQRRLYALRALSEDRAIHKSGDIKRLQQLAQKLEILSTDPEVTWNMIPLSIKSWLAVIFYGEGGQLVPRLIEAQRKMQEAGDQLGTIRVMSRLALAYTRAGQLQQSYQQCREALALIELSGGRSAAVGNLYANLFDIFYSWNRLDEASDWLKQLRNIATLWNQVELLVLAELCSVQFGLATGDWVTVQQALQEAEALVEQEGFTHFALLVKPLRVRVWLAEGDLIQASAWAAQTSFSDDGWDPLRKREWFMLVRVWLALQRYDLAADMLSGLREYLDQPAGGETTIHFLALSVVALYHVGKREEARRCAARLFALTEPEGMIRLYLDAGLQMKQALEILLETLQTDDLATQAAVSALEMPISRPYVTRLLAAFKQLSVLPSSDPGRPVPVETQTSRREDRQQLPLVEPLSPQELKVLQRLCAGQTYAEMAEALIVSPNTIKTQVNSIYRKLGVSRRAEAIAASQHLHLL